MTAIAKNDFVALLDKGFSFISEKSIKYRHYTKSLIVHFFLVLLLSGMLPKCSKDIEKPKIIAIDILPIGEAPKTTPQAQAPKPKVEEKKPEVKKPEEKKPEEKKPEEKKPIEEEKKDNKKNNV
jgi:outer membrane biosynthesis protein TonB